MEPRLPEQADEPGRATCTISIVPRVAGSIVPRVAGGIVARVAGVRPA